MRLDRKARLRVVRTRMSRKDEVDGPTRAQGIAVVRFGAFRGRPSSWRIAGLLPDED